MLFSDINFNRDLYVIDEEVFFVIIFDIVSLFFNIVISIKSDEFEKDSFIEGDN